MMLLIMFDADRFVSLRLGTADTDTHEATINS
jgi:hypothetical protein